MRSKTSTTGPTWTSRPVSSSISLRQAGLERFAELQPAARQAPLPCQRFEPPLDEHDFAVLDDDRADADDRLAGYCRDGRDAIHRRDFILGLKAQRMQDAALTPDQSVFDPELIVAGAGRDFAVSRSCSWPRHSACIAPVSTRAIIRTCPLRRARKRSRQILPHGVAPATQ